MTASHLASSRVNLAVLRESYRRELLDSLDKCEGTKALVWDDALTGPFGLIAEYTLLKEHGVEKMFPLRAGRLPASTVSNIIFIVRPKCSLMENVAQNVLKDEGSKDPFKKEFHILFVPRRSLLCEKKLKELGVYGTFTTVDEYCLDIIPLDSDVLSMELNDSFRQCCLESDHTSMFHAAKALMTLQALYGIIPNIYGKGECAERVVEMMMRMRRELAGQESHVLPQIDNLLVLDRMVDPLTPLLSQLTYEGLIDEIFGINHTSVRLPAESFNVALGESSTEMKKLELNSSSELFAELRDRNFNSVGPTLVKKVKLFTAQMDERHTAKIQELKQFVTKLPHMLTAKTNYSIHTALAQLVRDVTEKDDFIESLTTQQELINEIGTDKSNTYIEDCIARREPIVKVLRLMCLQCYCNNGLKPKLLEFYKREIVQAYGFEHIVSLHNLEKVGLLRAQGVGRTYATIRKSLKLIDEKVNEQNPTDISYVFSGYAPLSVRLAQILHKPGWRSITEVLPLLPGPTIEDVQQIPGWLRNRKRTGSGSSTQSSNAEQKVTLVFFLGGVTYAEISALRFLSQLEDGMEYIVATTKLINGATWLQSVMDTFTPKPPNPF